MRNKFLLFMLLLLPGMQSACTQDTIPAIEPVEHIYKTVNDRALRTYVFLPAGEIAERAAVVIFHGGGWSIGEPSWGFARARQFAGLGIAAIVVEYRLSDQISITPLEAIEDARDAVKWTRSQAKLLGIDPDRIAAFGWSAGGHLAVSTSLFPGKTSEGEIDSVPNALILISPALHLERDGWAQRLLGTRADISSISPVSHARSGLPPTLILQGSEDTVTPLEGARLFYDRMIAAGNKCDLQVYPEVGHLFTPAHIRDDGWPQPDSEVQASASERIDDFLTSLGYMR